MSRKSVSLQKSVLVVDSTSKIDDEVGGKKSVVGSKSDLTGPGR